METLSQSIESLKPVKYKRGQHPNSRANLGPPFKKGHNGNQQGYSLRSLLQDALKKPLKTLPDDASAREKLVYSSIEGAIKREPTPFKEVWERVDGKVDEHVTAQITGKVVFLIGKGYEK